MPSGPSASALTERIDDPADAVGAPREVVERDTLALSRPLGRSGLLAAISRGGRPRQAPQR